ncbi:MAG TPA: AraC family transcriptional regulator [Terrimicrobiaceae bacterium]|nr:AraC family transcriptional regulator [Terrimicrobiaceae bacterium]
MSGLKHFFKPYPIDTRALSIHGIGIQEDIGPAIINRPRGTKDCLLMSFYQPCQIRDFTGDALRGPDSFVAWKPSTPHWYGNSSRRWSHSWLHADGSKLVRWMSSARIPWNTVLALNEGSIFERHLEMLHRELTGAFPPDEKIASNILENAIREIGRAQRMTRSPAIPKWLMEARAFLDANYARPIRLEELGARFHRSVPYFCEQFRKTFQTPPMEYVIRLRLQRAAYLLRDHNLHIGEIARLCGYDDIYHFSKMFKKRHGRSPSACRRGAQG